MATESELLNAADILFEAGMITTVEYARILKRWEKD